MLERVATYAEIEEKWTLGTVLDANEALDIKNEAEARAREQAEKQDGTR